MGCGWTQAGLAASTREGQRVNGSDHGQHAPARVSPYSSQLRRKKHKEPSRNKNGVGTANTNTAVEGKLPQ